MTWRCARGQDRRLPPAGSTHSLAWLPWVGLRRLEPLEVQLGQALSSPPGKVK
jgi:hypothetical protein